MFNYAFIDFDKTVFDCMRFEDDIKAVFARHGVTVVDYRSTYLRSLCTVSPEEFDYSFEEQIKFLREIGYDLNDEVLFELNALLAADRYLFNDTLDFLNGLRTQANKCILLTAGDREFQLKKVSASGLSEFFDEVVVVNGFKDQYLKNLISENDRVLFVNDSLRENLNMKNNMPQVEVVGKLPPNRYLENDIKASGIVYFDTLAEIQNYVSKLS